MNVLLILSFILLNLFFFLVQGRNGIHFLYSQNRLNQCGKRKKRENNKDWWKCKSKSPGSEEVENVSNHRRKRPPRTPLERSRKGERGGLDKGIITLGISTTRPPLLFPLTLADLHELGKEGERLMGRWAASSVGEKVRKGSEVYDDR